MSSESASDTPPTEGAPYEAAGHLGARPRHMPRDAQAPGVARPARASAVELAEMATTGATGQPGGRERVRSAGSGERRVVGLREGSERGAPVLSVWTSNLQMSRIHFTYM